MLKIIKYSITFIIFSIILSLFVLYFYLLKGISIENINYNFINIGKLYIKIDKKIILKAQNIHINYKNKEKSENNSLNLKKIKSLSIKTLHALEFFQIIELKNLSINQNKLNLIKFKQNMLTIDNNSIYLKTLIVAQKKSIIFRTYTFNIKNPNIAIHNIYTICKFSPYQLKINSDFNYRDSKSKFNMTITKNKRMFYEGNILNISKNTLAPILKNNLNNINNLLINKIYLHGNKESLYFKIINIKANNKQIKLHTPEINGNLNINRNKLLVFNKNLYIDSNNSKIDINNTKLYYRIDKQIAILINKHININNQDKNISINLYNNRIFYSKIATISSKLVKIKQNLTNIKIENIKAQYLNQSNQLYAFIPIIKITHKKIISILNSIVLIYNNKEIKTTIPYIKTTLNKSIATIQNLTAIYKNKKITSNVNKIVIQTPQANGTINTNQLTYNLKTNKLDISNKQALINYLNIKNIKLNNIKTSINIKQKKLSTNIPNSNINHLNISNININIEKNILQVLFNTQTLLSAQVIDILKNFKINIPIYQKYGKNNIKANIKYNLKNSNLDTDIKIKVNNSRLMLSKNSHIDIFHSNVELKNSNIFLHNTLLEYNQSIVNVKYLINNGVINLNKSYIKTDGIFKDLNITNIVEIKNYPEQVHIYLKGIDIFLKNLKTNILIHKNIIVNIDKLSKFYPYISYLKQYKLNNGHIKVVIGNDINISSHITKTKQTILEKNLKPLRQIDINTTISNNNFHIYNNDIDMNITNDTNLTTIKGKYKNLDLNITQFVDKNESNSSNNTNVSANIKAKNTYIRYNDMKLYSDHLSIDYNTTNTKIESLYKDRNLTVIYNNGDLKIYGLNIKEKTFKDITTTNILHNPLINLFVIKNKNSDIIHGFMDIKKGYVKELKALTNILAFINLVPSLVTFQPVGFSTKGYKIKKAHVEFMYYNNIIYLRKLYVKGINMTFKGQGFINLNTQKLNINIDVILMVKLLNNIPIVNYILFGKNNGLTLKITLKGNMKDPEVAPNVTQNILSAPLNIIKRTLLTPFRPFMEEK